MKRYRIGIDIGGTNIRIGAVDNNQQVHHFKKIYQKTIFSDDQSITNLTQFLSEYMEENDLRRKVTSISIAIPATINKDCTTVLQAPSLLGFDNLDIVTPLEKEFGIKVYLLKDVWTAALYDLAKQEIETEGVIIAGYIGTGIGNVLLFDGKIYKGYNGVSGELGHIPLLGDTLSCGCGNRGCIENYAGGKYLAKLAEENQLDINHLFVELDSEKIEEYLNYVAMAIATEINIIDPSYVVLGGGVLSMLDFPLNLLEEKIRYYTRKPYPEKNLRLVFAADDAQKGVVGAVMYAKNMEEEYAESY